MKNKIWIFIFFLMAGLNFVSVSYAKTIQGVVIGIADGDTLTILDDTKESYRVRLSGIDAPESHQAFGQVSKNNLSRLVFKKNVTVVYEDVDRWGRLLGKVLLDGVDINLEQLKYGMAWWYERYKQNQTALDQIYYYYAELSAKEDKKGLWINKNPVEPWLFRKQ